VGKSEVCKHTGAVALVAEVQLNTALDPSFVGIFFSIAGRESVLGLHWPLQHGRIDARVLEDLQASVARQVALSIETLCGIQGVLPMV
jgi:hypothetical protein